MPQAIPLLFIAAGNLGWIAMTAAQIAAIASTIAIGAMEAKKARKKASANRKDLQVILQSATEPHRTVYGRAKLSGPLVYVNSTGVDNNSLKRVIALTGHQIDAYEAIYFNDDLLTFVQAGPNPLTGSEPPLDISQGYFFGSVNNARYLDNNYVAANVEGYVGTTTQSASADLVTSSSGQWTTNHRLRGRAYLIVGTYYNPLWTEGLPNVQAVVRGKRLYDPRTTGTAWSRNPALVIRDYLTSILNVESARIDEASFIAAANVCDEWVSIDTSVQSDPAGWLAYMQAAVTAGTWELVSGTTYRQRRYTFDGVVTADSSPGDILEQMVYTCGGYLSYTGGAWRLVAGAYTAPTLTLTESDLRGSPSFQPKPPRRELANVVKGSFVGPMCKYEATDFSPLKATSLIADDGGIEMSMDIDLAFTNDAAACQRLASIFLYRSRQGVLSFPATLTGLALRPGDTVAVTLPRFGFSGEVFRVEGWTLSDDLGVDLVLREEAASIYTWTPTTTIQDPSPQLNLPNPWSVANIAGLTATSNVGTALVQNDGTILPRTLVSWNVITDAFQNKVEIETRLVGQTAWTTHSAVNDGDGQAYLLGLKTGVSHEIRARRVNAIGVVGAWASINHTPAYVNVGANLLKNSDWVEDIGFGSSAYSDARALRGWLAAGGGIVTPQIGRNFNDGTRWNVGFGGCYMYQGTPVASAFQGIYQEVPAQAGATYEASVYVSPHRTSARLAMSFLNSSGGIISEVGDLIDAGTGALGQEFYPNTHPRLWTSGTAPSGTTAIRFVLVKNDTTAGQTTSYAFWSEALLCVAPTGVTRETATPWTVIGASTLAGQVTQVETRDMGELSFGVPYTVPVVCGTPLTFTAKTAGTVLGSFTGKVKGVIATGPPGYQGRPIVFLRLSQGGVTIADSRKYTLTSYNALENAYFIDAALEVVGACALGSSVTVALMADLDPADTPVGNGNTAYVYGGFLKAQVVRS